MSWAATIGAIATAVLGPVIAFLFKAYWDNQTGKAADQQRQDQENHDADQNNVNVGKETGDINHSIDEQRSARDQWLKDHPS